MKQKMNISIFHKFTERFLIFTTLSSFFMCLLFILKDIFDSTDHDVINFITIGAVFISSVIIYLIYLIFFNEKTSTATFIRVLFFYTLFVGGVTFLLRHFFIFSGVVVVICAIAQTVLYKKFLEAFFNHDCFEIQCQEKNNTKLQKELYDYNIFLSEAAEGYKQNRVMLFILGIILTLTTGVSFATNIRFSIFTIILLFIYFICAYSNFFLYSHYVREATFASNGFVNVFDYRLKIFFTSVLIFSICFLISLLISSNHSPFKYYWIINLFKNKKTVTHEPAKLPEIEITENHFDELRALQDTFGEPEETSSSNILPVIIGIAAAAGIAWFFLKPFITKVFSKALKNADLKHVIKRFFRNLKLIFKKLFHLQIKTNNFSSQNAQRFKNDISEYLKNAKKSKEKKAELDRLTKQFVLIIDFGEQHGVPYTKNLAPAEYTAMLKNASAQIAGQLFEQALYAKECLTKDEEDQFHKAVQAAIKEEAV